MLIDKVKVFLRKETIRLYIIRIKKIHYKNYDFENSNILICLGELGKWFDPRSVFKSKYNY